jgi:hypothetical protein
MLVLNTKDGDECVSEISNTVNARILRPRCDGLEGYSIRFLL